LIDGETGNSFIFGDPWIVSFYTYFDYEDSKIGFAKAKPYSDFISSRRRVL